MSMSRPRRVQDQGRAVVFSARVGAGHDAAASELARRLEGAGLVVDRRDFLDYLPGRLGRMLCESYHSMLTAAPWGYQALYGSLDRSRGLSMQASAACALASRRMLAAIGGDVRVVVSTYPLASQVLGRLRSAGRLDAPVVTYLTDCSVHRLWVADGVDAHTAVHEVAAGQARALGAAGVVTVDPAVDPRFIRGEAASRAAARERFALPADGPLALLVGGSWGVGKYEETVREIEATGAARCVVVCGRNEHLRQRLLRQGVRHVFGWVQDMPALMHAADVLVQNAGGMTVYEARACGLPVITYRTLPGHGETNARALDQAGTAPWVREAAGLRAALRHALAARPGEQIPEFAVDPVTVILGTAPHRPVEPARRIPGQRSTGAHRPSKSVSARSDRPGEAP